MLQRRGYKRAVLILTSKGKKLETLKFSETQGSGHRLPWNDKELLPQPPREPSKSQNGAPKEGKAPAGDSTGPGAHGDWE